FRQLLRSTLSPYTTLSRSWPPKPTAEAHRELLDCLNRERPRKLCIEEFIAILKMAREAGFHQAKHWIDAEIGYQPTPPTDPKIKSEEHTSELQSRENLVCR